MSWFSLSLIVAFLSGTSDALCKKALQKSAVATVAWVRPGWGSLFLLPLIFWAQPPTNVAQFWTYTFLAIPFEVAACLCFHASIRSSPLSLSIPYLAFTPVFLLFEEWIFLGQRPTVFGAAGVLAVTLGAFLLQPKVVSWRNEKGPVLMLLTAFLFSVTTLNAKQALTASSAFYFSSLYYPLVAVALLPFQFRVEGSLKALVSQPAIFLSVGALEGLGFILQFIAFEQTHIAYVISIKRLSLLLSVFYGWLFFKEQHILSRLTGALFMFAGAVLIAFS